MRIPTRTRYGLRAMVEIATGYPDKPISLRQVAKKQSLSIKYLEQLITPLKTAELVRSIRGVHGGYLIAKPPAEISLFEIYLALDGSVALVDCVANNNRCPHQDSCTTQPLWAEMSDALEKILKSKSIASLLEEMSQKRDVANN